MGWSIELSIVLKATVILGLTIIALALTRHVRASARHLLLASTFGTLLMLPIAAAVLPPFFLEIKTSEATRVALPPSALPNLQSVERVTPVDDRSHTSDGDWAAVSARTRFRMGWAIGAIFFLGPVVGGLWRLRNLRRHGLPWLDKEAFIRELSIDTGIRGTVEILLHEDVPSPATCGFTRPAVVFPIDAQEWSESAVRQAMVHELEHVRRGDWIVHLLARVVCALYWFHPFVWIGWRQLCLEAEHACDDAVLRGAERTQYAQQLVGLARRLTAADSLRPFLSMASRGDLFARVSAVLDTGRSRGRVRPFHGAVIVTMAVVVVMAISPLRAVPVSGHQSTAATSKPIAFEVASVKPNKSGDVGMGMQALPGGFRANNVTVRLLLRTAYRIQESQLTGGPDWLDSDRFDIVAKTEANSSSDQLSLMLQALLADRFKVMIHKETRERSIFALVVARNGALGPRLQRRDCVPAELPAAPAASSQELPCGRIMTGSGEVTFRGAPMSQIAEGLSGYVGRVVADRTGLSGNYDLTLQWTPERLPNANQQPGSDVLALDPNGLSIFTAVQEQLGLKLQPAQGTVNVLVIDRVEHPTEN
jgi:uncharacterized protein (TIGR03435 family)